MTYHYGQGVGPLRRHEIDGVGRIEAAVSSFTLWTETDPQTCHQYKFFLHSMVNADTVAGATVGAAAVASSIASVAMGYPTGAMGQSFWDANQMMTGILHTHLHTQTSHHSHNLRVPS